MADLHPFARAKSQAEAIEVSKLIDDLREYLSDHDDVDAEHLLKRLNELFPEQAND